jgi:hypothetical protein
MNGPLMDDIGPIIIEQWRTAHYSIKLSSYRKLHPVHFMPTTSEYVLVLMQ